MKRAKTKQKKEKKNIQGKWKKKARHEYRSKRNKWEKQGGNKGKRVSWEKKTLDKSN